MRFTAPELASFWSAAWSLPFRSACRWIAPDWQTHVERDAEPPSQLTPLCLQRWVGQAIRARLIWMSDHPEAAAYRYSGSSDECDPSSPYWTDKATACFDRLALHREAEERLLWNWNVEVERLLRICNVPLVFAGEDTWVQAVLGSSRRLSQLYTELKRRHRALPARAMLREELRVYIVWDYRAAA